MGTRGALWAAALLLAGCGTASRVVVLHPDAGGDYDGQIRILAAETSPPGVVLGRVAVQSVQGLARALLELEERVRQLGGDAVVIDGMAHSVELAIPDGLRCGPEAAPLRCRPAQADHVPRVVLLLEARVLRTRGGP